MWKFRFVGGCLLAIFLLSGCLEGETVYYGIDVELLSEDKITDLTYPSTNITHLDFNDYPTLYHAITFLLTSSNQSSVLLETPKEEWGRIQSVVGGSYYTYNRFYFSIAYVIS